MMQPLTVLILTMNTILGYPFLSHLWTTPCPSRIVLPYSFPLSDFNDRLLLCTEVHGPMFPDTGPFPPALLRFSRSGLAEGGRDIRARARIPSSPSTARRPLNPSSSSTPLVLPPSLPRLVRPAYSLSMLLPSARAGPAASSLLSHQPCVLLVAPLLSQPRSGMPSMFLNLSISSEAVAAELWAWQFALPIVSNYPASDCILSLQKNHALLTSGKPEIQCKAMLWQNKSH